MPASRWASLALALLLAACGGDEAAPAPAPSSRGLGGRGGAGGAAGTTAMSSGAGGATAAGGMLLRRPASLPNLNYEGIAIGSEAECTDGEKPFFWVEDGVNTHVLQQGTIRCGLYL